MLSGQKLAFSANAMGSNTKKKSVDYSACVVNPPHLTNSSLISILFTSLQQTPLVNFSAFRPNQPTNLAEKKNLMTAFGARLSDSGNESH